MDIVAWTDIIWHFGSKAGTYLFWRNIWNASNSCKNIFQSPFGRAAASLCWARTGQIPGCIPGHADIILTWAHASLGPWLHRRKTGRQICQTMLKISSVFMRNSENLYCRKSLTSIIYENYVSAWFKKKIMISFILCPELDSERSKPLILPGCTVQWHCPGVRAV